MSQRNCETENQRKLNVGGGCGGAKKRKTTEQNKALHPGKKNRGESGRLQARGKKGIVPEKVRPGTKLLGVTDLAPNRTKAKKKGK